MKNILTATAFAATLLCGVVLAQSTTPSSTEPSTPQQPQAQPTTPSQTQQQPSPPSATTQNQAAPAAPGNQTQPATSPKIAPGSVIPVQLTKSIDAKKAKTGDEVVARVTQDMKTSSGDVLVAKDTKMVGHVTEAQKRSKDQKESEVGIAFDRAVMKDGTEMPLPMSIQAIIGQQNPNANAPTGGDQPYSTSAPSSAAGAGRTGGMGSIPQQSPSASASAGNMPTDSPSNANTMPQVTAQTQGVVGISDLKLSAGTATQGSVVTSEKNNVKLEGGTMLLLKVNQ